MGGIGNQLFIYAAARHLAIKAGADLVLDHVSGFSYDYVYARHYQLKHFNIEGREASWVQRLEPFSKPRRFIKRFLNRYRSYEKRKYIYQDVNEFDSRLLKLQFNGNLYLEGYWQSERFFKDIERIIRCELKIKPPTDTPNKAMAERIQGTRSVAIHVRFFDDPGKQDDMSLKYYNKAVRIMEDQISDTHYFVFSDRPEEAVSRLDLPSDKFTIVSHNQGDANAYADLWLMSLCNHFIIANSTFSWWGAWLAASEDKIVIAPEQTDDNRQSAIAFRNMLLDDWIKC